MKKTILIVEDEYLIARNLRNILLEEGYDVISEIESVEDAILVLERQPVHLVVLDINLKKDKDGIYLGHYLLNKATIPFVYITSYSDKLTLDRAGDTRPQGYLVKPFKAMDVISTVSIVLNNFNLREINKVREMEEPSDEIPFILQKVIDYINENIQNKITSDHLKNLTRWESAHFLRLFKKYVGQTPYKYITSRKMERAKALLTDTDIPIRQISYELGYLNHTNFCRAFKVHTGINPNEFRIKMDIRKYR
ncbi:MAG: hypothetical protein CFE24_13460 [Flavobacterium sp. BFFFF2]|nr:MAG: hypothetical protein CFE24_13460 [Flavobacterium sp. BFFFF2]